MVSVIDRKNGDVRYLPCCTEANNNFPLKHGMEACFQLRSHGLEISYHKKLDHTQNINFRVTVLFWNTFNETAIDLQNGKKE